MIPNSTTQRFHRSVCSAIVAAAFGVSPALAAAPSVADVYAQAKAGDPAVAINMATTLVETRENLAAALEARAYVYRGLKRYTEALADYQRLLELDPRSSVGMQGTVASLRAVGAAQLAQQYAATRPDLFTAAEMRDIGHAVASAFTRLGATDPHTGSAAFELTDKALKQFDGFTRSAGVGEPVLLPGHMGYDYLVAQFNRRRFNVVCDAFERLARNGEQLPDYVVHVAAQSYASMRRSDRALELLEPLAERNKNDSEFIQSYFYALVDNEQHARAEAWLDEAVAHTPSHLDPHSPRLRRPNPAYVRLVGLAAWSRAFDDRLPASREYFKAALHEAPANESLRDGMGTVELWSGRPRAAYAQFQQAIALNPSAIESHRGLIAADAARGDERAVREGLDRLLAKSPFDAQLLRMRADQAIRTGPSFSIGLGRSTAHVPAKESSPEYNARFQAKSALMLDRYRVVATGVGSRSAPDSTDIDQRWASVGVEMQHKDLAASVSLTRNRAGHTGLTATARVSPHDDWSFGVEGDSLTSEVPSRAVQAGVRGNRFAASAEWQPRVDTALSASVNRTSLSDNNAMTSANVKWRETWHQQAKLQLWSAVLASTFSSTNQAVSYFSPKSSAGQVVTLGGSVLGDRKAWLDRSVWHHLELDLGRTEQHSFKAVRSNSARYRLSFKASARVSAEVAFERARRVYDGKPEMQNALRLELSVTP
jgi:poly-beta-1,6 N-acetyl-D-glucosamine export porin PgaA